MATPPTASDRSVNHSGAERERTAADRLAVYQDLFGELAVARHAEWADTMAEALLRYEQGERELIGLAADCQHALYLLARPGPIVAVRFDKHGVREDVDRTLARRVSAPGEWARLHAESLVWTHPRYRL